MDKFNLNKPHRGDLLNYRGKPCGTITNVEGSLCHYEQPGGQHAMFIWVFHDGLNQLYDWPNKWKTRMIIMGDPVAIANSRAG